MSDFPWLRIRVSGWELEEQRKISSLNALLEGLAYNYSHKISKYDL